MITLEMMPPMMFGGLVLAMLIGFPVAFTLAAVGLIIRIPCDPSWLLRSKFPSGHTGARVWERAV